MSDKPTVLVTGASGFVGSHILVQLLEAGYPIRAVARGAKVQQLQAFFKAKGATTAAEVFEITDIVTDDLTEALKGVGAIIHAASPLAGRASAQDTLKMTIDGTMSVLRAAAKNGVSKVIITSSWGTALDPDLKQTYAGKTFTAKDWGECTAEQVVDGTRNPLWIYLAAKTLAEKEAWKFAAETPAVDLTTINPPFIYGPFIDGLAPASFAGAGTNRMVYGLIVGEKGRAPPMQLSPYYIDVRDVATAHVRALSAPPASDVGALEKRFLISGGVFFWKDAAAYLAEARPELRDRLPALDAPGPNLPSTISAIDTAPAAEKLGLTEYIAWKDTVGATIDSFLALEKTWV